MSRDDQPSPSARRRRRSGRVGRTGARFPQFDPQPDPEPAPGAPAPESPDDGSAAGIADGPRAAVEAEAFAEDLDPAADPDSTVGRTGARFGGAGRRARRAADHAAAQSAAQDAVVHTQAPPVARPSTWDPAVNGPAPDDSPTVSLALAAIEGESSRTRVRPYVRTGGRTRARTDLDIATLVSIPRPRPPITHSEHLAVEGACDGPRSVAEVAALMEVPLGVARVLIDDMATAGLLYVHATALVDDRAPSQDFMRRVLEGLRRL